MQMVQFHGVEAKRSEITYGRQHVRRQLPGQTEDDMRTEPQMALLRPPYGVVKGGDGVTAVEPDEGLVLPRFQTQLEPQISTRGVVCQEIQHRIWHTVRAGA